MTYISAELHLAGQTYPLAACSFGFHQNTDARGRPNSKVVGVPVQLLLDGDEGPELADWASRPDSLRSGEVVFYPDDPTQPRRTLAFTDARCVHQYVQLVPGADVAAHQCLLVLSVQQLQIDGQVLEQPWNKLPKTRAGAVPAKKPTVPAAKKATQGLKKAAAAAVTRQLVKTTQAAKTASFDEFCQTVDAFKGSQNADLAQLSYVHYASKKWPELEKLFIENKINEYASIIWPPNRGFVSVAEVVLEPDFVFDRYGGEYLENGEFSDKGTFIAGADTPFDQRALPEITKKSIKSTYVVLKSIPAVKAGPAIPWLDQPGLGIQYELPRDPKRGGINALIEDGYIKRID